MKKSFFLGFTLCTVSFLHSAESGPKQQEPTPEMYKIVFSYWKDPKTDHGLDSSRLFDFQKEVYKSLERKKKKFDNMLETLGFNDAMKSVTAVKREDLQDYIFVLDNLILPQAIKSGNANNNLREMLKMRDVFEKALDDKEAQFAILKDVFK